MELITNNANERILKLTDEESDAIEEAASISGMSVSDFVTECIEMSVFITNSEDDEYDTDEEDDDFDNEEDQPLFSTESKEALKDIAKKSGAAIADIISEELKK